MRRTRENCLRTLIPISVGDDDLLCEVFFHFIETHEFWDVWEASIVRYPGEGISEYLGEAPRWVIDAMQRDFEARGQTYDLAREAFEFSTYQEAMA